MVMTWGKPAIEVLFGGPVKCDLCRSPAIAFDAGRSRCGDHLTPEMKAERDSDELQSRPYYPGRPRVNQP